MPRPLFAGDDHNLLANRNGGEPHAQYGRKDNHGAGGTLPAGLASGDTLLWDGAAWVENGYLTISPTIVGVTAATLSTKYIETQNSVFISGANEANKLSVAKSGPGLTLFDVDTATDRVGLLGAVRFLRTPVNSSPYNLATRDTYLAVNTNAARTINLPAASDAERFIIVKDAVGTGALINNITIAGNGGDTIDQVAANLVLAVTRVAIRLYSDGISNWELQ